MIALINGGLANEKNIAIKSLTEVKMLMLLIDEGLLDTVEILNENGLPSIESYTDEEAELWLENF